MAIVNLEDLKPGMVLAADAVHLNGRVLLRSGTELTERHIQICKMWGLTDAEVEGAHDEGIEGPRGIEARFLQEAESEMREAFRHTDLQHPAMAGLFRLCVQRRAQTKAETADDDPGP